MEVNDVLEVKEVKDFLNLQERIVNWAIDYAPKLLAAVIVLFIGFWTVKILIKMLDKVLKKSKVDISLHSFVKSISEFVMKIIVVITAATMIEIPVTTFIAILSAAGLAIGLALRDSLANFAGGILILAFGIFKVEDFIESEGHMGTVKEIKLLYTRLITVDNKRLIIPNGDLATKKIINYTAEKMRRVDMVFGIGYEDDIDKAKKVLENIISKHDLVMNDMEHLVHVSALNDYSVDLAVKVWCDADDYWTIYFDFQEEVKKSFDREEITIPYPKSDLNIYDKSVEQKELKV